MRTFISTLLVMLAAVLSQAQVGDSIASRMALQRYVFPQEKIHVMTDKPRYMAGDTIWFRAWVVDAASHQPVDASQFVYVELQNPLDTVVTRIKLRQCDGAFSGHIALSPAMAEGTYQLTAYTMFMQSLGERYFFKRLIEVTSPLATHYRIVSQPQWDDNALNMNVRIENRQDGSLCSYYRMGYVTNNSKWHRRMSGDGVVRFSLKGKELDSPAILVMFDHYKKYITMPRRGDDYELSFFPEGGYLVPQHDCAMTFKALSSDGNCAVVTGRIIDSTGREVASLSTIHDGMGLVRFMPQAGMTYTAIVTDAMGLNKQFVLPAVRERATVLHVEHPSDTMITVRAVGHDAQTGIVVVQQRGNVLAVGQGDITLDLRQIPAGVVQCLLLDEHWHRLSERLFFNADKGRVAMAISTDKVNYGARELVCVSGRLIGASIPQGDYAVSVTDDRAVALESASEICVNLLLQSELKGRINNPEYYFADESPSRYADLDMLMMTQGWSRYDLSQALRGHLAEPQFPIEKSQVVSGRVTSEWRKQPIQNATVNLMVPKAGIIEQGVTDADGRFNLSLSNFPDGGQCVLQATDEKGKRIMNVKIDEDTYPQVVGLDIVADTHHAVKENDYLDSELLRATTIDGMRNILLDEVTVVSSKAKAEDIFELISQTHFDEETFKREGITTLEEVVRKIAGIRIVGGNIVSARGATSIFGNSRYNSVPVFINASGLDGELNVNADVSHPIGLGTRTAIKADASAGDMPQGSSSSSETSDQSLFSSLSDLSELSHVVQFQDIKRIEYIAPNTANFLGSQAGKAGALIIITKTGEEMAKSKVKNYYLHTITPLGYQKPAEFYAPRYDHGDCGTGEGTDLRNTLYWNPKVSVDSEGKSSFDFYTNDVGDTSYSVTIEGVTHDGQLIHAKHAVVVR